jgi:hypothetical protein
MGLSADQEGSPRQIPKIELEGSHLKSRFLPNPLTTTPALPRYPARGSLGPESLSILDKCRAPAACAD